MTPRRIRQARAQTAQPPAVITAPGNLTAQEAAAIIARWRRISRYPALVIPDRFTVTVLPAPTTQRRPRTRSITGV